MKFQDLVNYFERLEATSKRLEMFEILAELFRLAEPGEIAEIIYLSQGQLLPSFQGLEIGMSEKLLIRALAATTETEVSEISLEFKKSGDLGKTAERFVKGKGRGLSILEVYQVLLTIARTAGEGSVEKKISLLSNLVSKAQASEAKFISRFVVGRLRLGVGDAAVLEALSLARLGSREHRAELERAYNLCSDLGLVAKMLFEKGLDGVRKIKVQLGYPIRMALCERLTSADEIIGKLGRCSVEAKYDGFRCQIHKMKDRIEIFSRNLERTTPMFPEIVEAAETRMKAETLIFEGEALAYQEATGELLPFQVTIQRKRKHGIEDIAKAYPLRFYTFDLLYLDGKDCTDQPYLERRKKLAQLIQRDTVLELSEAIETEDPKEIQQFFDRSIERGLEGIVAKRLDAPYSAGARNFNWIKLKRSYKGELSDTVDVCIVGYFKGKGHRAQFGLGTVLGAVYDQETDTFETISKIGSGFTEEELMTLSEMLDKIAVPHKPARVDSLMIPDVWVEPRYVVTVMADEITRSPLHTAGKKGEEPGYALRFPRVQGFIRQDKSPEDATTVKEVVKLAQQQRRVKLE
jgi:DNA ligase 1